MKNVARKYNLDAVRTNLETKIMFLGDIDPKTEFYRMTIADIARMTVLLIGKKEYYELSATVREIAMNETTKYYGSELSRKVIL